jgi:hypothetical protein
VELSHPHPRHAHLCKNYSFEGEDSSGGGKIRGGKSYAAHPPRSLSRKMKFVFPSRRRNKIPSTSGKGAPAQYHVLAYIFGVFGRKFCVRFGKAEKRNKKIQILSRRAKSFLPSAKCEGGLEWGLLARDGMRRNFNFVPSESRSDECHELVSQR